MLLLAKLFFNPVRKDKKKLRIVRHLLVSPETEASGNHNVLGKELPVIDSVKYLCEIHVLDKQLTYFNEHVSTLVSDLIGKLGIISRFCHIFDQSTLFTIS